ncbi:unnamed protein product [Ceutorhynchus assimilis]|uniref:DUF7869 domain-containing protein n=1 Tax=Ceutorhynchus assimilis TaxID=467358 RepID=A0A9N9QT20_9CUCU|nr:unnamed protein product [Ceutorhynchus assimilis]
MAGPSARTRKILKLAIAAAEISEDFSETDEEPFLDSGSEYKPESDGTDEERAGNSSKRKRVCKRVIRIKKKSNEDIANVFENQEQIVIRPGQDEKQTQNINDLEEPIQVIEKELQESNDTDEAEEQQIIEMEEEINIPDVGVEVNQRINEKKARKLQAQPKNWKRNVNMLNREQGKAYTDYKNRHVPEKSSAVGIQLCTEKCRLKCNSNFDDADRNTLFNQYYSLPTSDEKNVYLFGCMKPFDVKQPSGINAIRQKSFRYFITLDGKSKQVCKSAFLKLLNVGRKKLELIRNQISQGQALPHKDQRGRHINGKNQTPNDQLDVVRQHIKSFPADMSHYSRTKNEHRLYLSPMLSINKMYDLYKNHCSEQNLPFVKNSRYRKIFVSEFNFGFGSPKSDTCKVCDCKENTDEHVRRYKAAFAEQKKDRNLAHEGTILFINFDMQKTLPLPKLSTSVAFYLRQVWLYNLGIHCVSKGDTFGKGFFHLWTEDKGSRGPEEVGSSVLSFLQSINIENDHLVAWSDSAGGQNKNFFIVCLWHYLVHQKIFKTIDHKFPEVGHSFMDIDRDFGAVEKVIRKVQNIYTVDQYMTLMREARKRNPFVLTRMEDKFIDLKELSRKLNLLDRKKSSNGEKIIFRNVRWIRVDKFGTTKYRYSLDENEEWKEVEIIKRKPTRTTGQHENVLVPVNKSRPITAKKFDNIQEQLPFIPENLRGYYMSLNRSESD